MHFLAVALLCAPIVSAQLPSMADIDRAKIEVSRLEELVREGAVAKSRLEKAKDALADAEDDAVLRRTLFGKMSVEDLTNDQSIWMVEAAKRRVARTENRLEGLKKLVDDGVLARTELTPELEELDMRRRTLDLAESRERTFKQLLEMIQAEQEAEARAADARAAADAAQSWKPLEKYAGSGIFQLVQLRAIEKAFEKKFSKELPVSALGMTELHRSMGYDHRDRVDVALTPDSAEGLWLRKYLEDSHIPYFAFRTFIPGSATGAHIHIGPPSLRMPRLAMLQGSGASGN